MSTMKINEKDMDWNVYLTLNFNVEALCDSTRGEAFGR